MEKLDGAAIDLLFTDIVMPGAINGIELARIARLKQPALKILFTSGFPGSADVPAARVEAGDALLTKPYRRTDLAHVVRRVLDVPQDDAAEAWF